MAIVSDPRFAFTNPKDWKRKSKTKNEQGRWVRIFENKTTNQIVNVVENVSSLVIEDAGTMSLKIKNQSQGAGNPQSPIYFNAQPITKNNYEEYGDENSIGNYILCLTTKEYWESEHCQIDYTPDWVIPIIEELGFPGEDMENVWIIDLPLLLKIRRDNRFYESPEFGNFMDSVGE
jgi:hypothetical protein